MQINVPLPMESNCVGLRCSVCVPQVLPIRTQVTYLDLSKCSGNIIKSLDWVNFVDVTCDELPLQCKKEQVWFFASGEPPLWSSSNRVELAITIHMQCILQKTSLCTTLHINYLCSCCSLVPLCAQAPLAKCC
jgi:hypothetical protein